MTVSDQDRLTLETWAGAQYLGLTLVFTDIVDSTRIGIKLGDTKWIEALFQHFSIARTIALKFDSYVVKAIGDSLMMAFRRSSEAVQFAVQFAADTGVEYIGVRVGIHAGEVEIRDNDIYGLNVNLASRVQHQRVGEGILVTDFVRRDYDRRFGTSSGLRFSPREVDLKSFGKEIVYLVRQADLTKAVTHQRTAREALLNRTQASVSPTPYRQA